MGGKDRNSRPTKPLTPAELSKLVQAEAPIEEDPVAEWADVATGTPPRDSLPTVSRTATRHDPLTTGLLAEVTRHPEGSGEDAPPSAPHTVKRR